MKLKRVEKMFSFHNKWKDFNCVNIFNYLKDVEKKKFNIFEKDEKI